MRRPYRVLFVSWGDSARGLIAQALLEKWNGERFRSWCASLHGQPGHPLILGLLESHRLWKDHESEPLERFVGESAPVMDFVISVGDKLPAVWWKKFPGSPIEAQWRITDPLVSKIDPMERKARLRRAFVELENRTKLFALVWGRSFEEPDLAA